MRVNGNMPLLSDYLCLCQRPCEGDKYATNTPTLLGTNSSAVGGAYAEKQPNASSRMPQNNHGIV